ncbi:MFS transporter [Paenibacillus sp. N4]|uniref:MFS transporter n=1 Tax=Paenibacillus vietnamensis TaxID=2590547 RepID=UPI001CD08014|nr:MFS transporter [Paenibacillus vietnamensis]MCA0757538.1 MFS transporter [Paenibacillus vietnamensis]
MIQAGGTPALRSKGRMQAALLGCVFLGLFTEMLLSPYYTQFFSQVFGIEDYSYTGFYLFVCRLTVVLCSPVWGWLARKAEAKRLLLAGQAGTALATALLASAGSATEFIVLTVLLLLFKSSYMLIYPIVMELGDQGGRAGSAAKFHAVHHTAILLASLAGAHMLTMEKPLTLFYGAAAADVVQLLVCIAVLRGWKSGLEPGGEPAQPKSTLGKPLLSRYVLTLGMLFFSLTVANQIVRPFFTPYAEEAFRLTTDIAGLLYLLPHAFALLLLPVLGRICRPGRLHTVYLSGVGAMAAGLMLQALTDGVAGLIIGRMLYGMFLAITMAVLDVILFEKEQGAKAALVFSVMVSFQTAGELLSPLIASFLSIRAGLGAPLLAASMLCLVNGLLFKWSHIYKAPKEATKWNLSGSKI